MIQRSNLKIIRLMEFSQVMANVKTFLEKEDLNDLGLVDLKSEFDIKFKNLEEAVKPLRKSEHTHKIKELDSKRDAYLMGFIGHCKLFINFPEKEKAEAAKKLAIVNENYGKNPQKKALREKTSIIRNLITDVTSSEFFNSVKLIGAEKWIEFLGQTNESLASLHTDRTQEQGAIKVGKSKEARTEMQDIFSKLVTAINGLSLVKEREKYLPLINSISEEVKRVLS
ncbi:MAG: DUF6261 family protein [Capnocytophaga sp.]|nr:DUF6261 family protein [Capnocytophaga sp.]